jgi:hypothetical protein
VLFEVDGAGALRLRVFDGGSTSTSASMSVAFLPQLSLAMVGNLQPPIGGYSPSSAGARRLDAAKWFVPGSLKVASDGGRSPEGGARVLSPCSSAATP